MTNADKYRSFIGTTGPIKCDRCSEETFHGEILPAPKRKYTICYECLDAWNSSKDNLMRAVFKEFVIHGVLKEERRIADAIKALRSIKIELPDIN